MLNILHKFNESESKQMDEERVFSMKIFRNKGKLLTATRSEILGYAKKSSKMCSALIRTTLNRRDPAFKELGIQLAFLQFCRYKISDKKNHIAKMHTHENDENKRNSLQGEIAAYELLNNQLVDFNESLCVEFVGYLAAHNIVTSKKLIQYQSATLSEEDGVKDFRVLWHTFTDFLYPTAVGINPDVIDQTTPEDIDKALSSAIPANVFKSDIRYRKP